MFPKSKKHGENMNDTVKNDQQENTEVTQERNLDQEESSLIDSLFFSTSTIALIGVAFLVAMFISGWYIFSLKDRQVELIKAKEWVDAHESIIISAKENQERLNALQDTIAKTQAEKNNHLVILNDTKES